MSTTKDKVPHAVDIAVGMNVRRLRKQRGLSQSVLADGCNLTFQQIQKYERGSNRISCSMLILICAALKCSPMDLLPAPGEAERSSYGDWAGELSEVYHVAPGLFEAVAEMNRTEIKALTTLAQVMVTERRLPTRVEARFDAEESERTGNAFRNDPRRLEELEPHELEGAA